MQLEEFSKGMDKLCGFFSKKLTDSQNELWFMRTKHLQASAFDQAVIACIDAERYFPTPRTLLDLADKAKIPTGILKANWNPLNDAPRGILGDYGADYRTQCRSLFKKIMHGEIDSFKLSEIMFDMAEKYKSKSWQESAEQVLSDWQIKNGQKPFYEKPKLQRNFFGSTSQCCFVEDNGWQCNRPVTISPSTTGPSENRVWFGYCREHWKG